jgi:hypothetical protein
MDELKHWIENEMQPEVWLRVNAYQLGAIKMMIAEQYGWPDFTLNINKEGNKVQKTII